MNYEKKIEFYKDRSIGERLSAAADFLRQTWQILLRNALIIGLPFALVIGYSMPYYTQYVSSGHFGEVPPQIILWMLASFAGSITLFSLGGAVMILYERGSLTSETGWNELWPVMFPLIKKTVAIGLCLFGILALAGLIIGFLTSLLAFGGVVVAGLLILLFCMGLLTVFPALLLVFYPAYFRDEKAWQSIKTAFYLGFRDWGSIFVGIIVVGIMVSIVSVIFTFPYQILNMFTRGEIGFVGFVLASLSSIASLLLTPVGFIFFAFHYFSIVEKEEGVSRYSQIDEFDNL